MTQFVAAFNDIVINRHEKDRSVKSRLRVRYVYSPKQRVVHDLTNKARHLTLPVVAVNITSISRDESRVFNKLTGAYFSNTETTKIDSTESKIPQTSHMPQPVPINISVSMSILTRYQTDVEQIISNFVPYNDPYIVISWKLPEEFSIEEQEIRSEVEWNGDLQMEYPEKLSGNEPYRVSCETSFVIKTWLFKQHSTINNNIFKITTNISPTNEITPDLSYTLPFYDDLTERSYLTGLGPPLTAAPFITHVTHAEADSTAEIIGYNFYPTTNVYISGAHVNTLSSEDVTLYPDRANLNTLYPSFSGVPVNYTITNDNKLVINLPIVSKTEVIDIIITNPGGYDTILNSTLHGKGVMLSADI